MKEKIVSLNELKKIIRQQKKRGKIIVATGGCFDILHAGHVLYLEEAAKKGDVLVIFLNSDSSVRELKGNLRPIVPELERAVVLSALQCVDYICIFNESTPCRMIEEIHPDIFVKGGDYQGKTIAEMESVRKYNGKVEYVSLVNGCSTTNIINRIMSTRGEVI